MIPIAETIAFDVFGAEHVLAAAITLGLGLAVPASVRRAAGATGRTRAARLLAGLSLIYVGAGLVVRTRMYGLPLAENLPLHICGITVILGAAMLWRRSFRLYEVLYFWGTGGTFAALLTPDLVEGFPGALFLLFFIGHGLAFLAVMFATIVWRFRPVPASLAKALLATAAYAAVIYPINGWLGSNYLYLARKPAHGSPLDYLGPWPWYLLGLAAATIAVCALCYAPFGLRDALGKRGHGARVEHR